MRIIGGKFKGRKLPAPQLEGTRPTTDFARESLFNILQSRGGIEGMKVLDLYSGTGAMAFECISRGAEEVTCVDISGKALAFISKTAKEWDCKIQSIKADVIRFLHNEKNTYDLIIADPPYDSKSIAEIPILVFEKHLLKKNGLLVVEHGKETDLSGITNFNNTRTYGRVHFSFFPES